jgi:hypothetical protein
LRPNLLGNADVMAAMVVMMYGADAHPVSPELS